MKELRRETSVNSNFSNVGYVLLGILFLLIVKHRDTKYQSAVKERPVISKMYV